MASGRSRTWAGRPATAKARRALKMAAPPAIRSAHPCGSATGSVRLGSASTSSPPSRTRKRHGWVLCIDGARIAASTARWNTVASIVVLGAFMMGT